MSSALAALRHRAGLRRVAFMSALLFAAATATGGASTGSSPESKADPAPQRAVAVQSSAYYKGAFVSLRPLLDRSDDIACHAVRTDGVATCFDSNAALIQDLVRLGAASQATIDLAVRQHFVTLSDIAVARNSRRLSSRDALLADVALYASAPCCSGLFDGFNYAGDSLWFQFNMSSLGAFNNRASSYLHGWGGTYQSEFYALQSFVQRLAIVWNHIAVMGQTLNNRIRSLQANSRA